MSFLIRDIRAEVSVDLENYFNSWTVHWTIWNLWYNKWVVNAMVWYVGINNSTCRLLKWMYFWHKCEHGLLIELYVEPHSETVDYWLLIFYIDFFQLICDHYNKIITLFQAFSSFKASTHFKLPKIPQLCKSFKNSLHEM